MFKYMLKCVYVKTTWWYIYHQVVLFTKQDWNITLTHFSTRRWIVTTLRLTEFGAIGGPHFCLCSEFYKLGIKFLGIKQQHWAFDAAVSKRDWFRWGFGTEIITNLHSRHTYVGTFNGSPFRAEGRSHHQSLESKTKILNKVTPQVCMIMLRVIFCAYDQYSGCPSTSKHSCMKPKSDDDWCSLQCVY